MLIILVAVQSIQGQEKRITGGSPINITKAPYQVLIRQGDDYTCGGSIIAPNAVLTAKHCVKDVSVSSIQVIVGVTCKNDVGDTNIYSVKKIIVHPNLDVAILILYNSIVYNASQQSVNYLSATNPLYYNVGNAVQVSGWGWLTPNGFDPTNCLRSVNLNIISNQDATDMLSDLYPPMVVGSNEVATTGVGTIRQGTCYADSGGPLVTWSSDLNEYVLIGVVSWGRSHCVGNNANSPSIFVRVSKIVDWITLNISSISGPSSFCDEATYSIEDLPEGATVQWSASDNLSLVSGQGTASAVFSKLDVGTCWVRATAKIDGLSIQLQKENIQAGPPKPVFGVFDNHTRVVSGYVGEKYYLRVLNEGNLTGYVYEWIILAPESNSSDSPSVNPDTPFPSMGEEHEFYPIIEGQYAIKLRYKNDCDWSEQVTTLFSCRNSEISFSLIPNPAKDQVTVQLDVNMIKGKNRALKPALKTTTRSNLSEIYEIQIWNNTMMLRKHTGKARSTQISLSGLPKGLYYVLIIKDGKIGRKVLIVE